MKRRNWMLVATIYVFAILAIIGMTLVASKVYADVTFSWGYSEEDQVDIDGFRIYNGDHVLVLGDIPAADREATISDPESCTGYYCLAFKVTDDGDVESEYSTIVAVCPPTVVIPAPGTFVLIK